MNEAFLKQAKAKAAKYCSLRERAPQQVLEKLLSWEVAEEHADRIVQELTSENFLDELRFCRAFCHDKFEFNQWGKNRIRLELSKYKLSSAVVEKGLRHIDGERYHAVLMELCQKKWNSLATESDSWKRKNKTAAYLMRKGFETDLIWDTVNDLSIGRT